MKKGKTEKRRIPARCVRQLLWAVFFCVLAALPAAAGELPGLSMKLGYGYRNMAKTGQLLPVTVSFSNQTGEEIQGFLSVEVPGNGTSVSYTQAVTVPEGESSVRSTVTIPDSLKADREDQLQARFFDDSGEEILTAGITVTYLGTGRDVFTGVLSEDPSALSYLGNVGLGTDLNTRVITLNPADMPEEEDGLSQLDVILISGFDMKRLSDRSVQAVMDWVSTGGTLILGTGSNPAPLGAFARLIGNPDLSYSSIQAVDMGMQYSNSGPDGAVIRIPVRRISWESSAAIQESSGRDLVLRRTFGKGSVCIASYDFCDISQFGGEHPEFAADLLTAAIGQTGLSRLQGDLLSGAQRLSEGKELTNTYEEAAVPGIFVYLAAAVLFVLLAGSVLFRYLASKGLSLFYLLGVLIFSMAFSLFLWFYSGRTRFSGPFIDYGMIRGYASSEEGCSVEHQAFISMQSPNPGAMTLELPADCLVRPISTVGQISITSGKTKMIAATGQKQFESNCFLVERSTGENGTELPFEVQTKLGETGLQGTVANSGASPLEGVTLVYQGQFQYIGRLEPGQTAEVSGEKSLFGPVAMAELVSAQIAKKLPKLPYQMQKENMLEYCLRESAAIEEGKVLLLGFALEGEPGFLADTGYEAKGSELICLSAGTVPEQEEGEIRIGYAASPRVVSGTYDPQTGCIRGNSTAVLQYSLGSGEQIESLSLITLSKELEGESVTAFRGQMALYNYRTSSYDLADAGKTTWTQQELEKYLSPANNLTVRYIPDEQTKEQEAVWLPMLCVKSSRRKDRPESAVSEVEAVFGQTVPEKNEAAEQTEGNTPVSGMPAENAAGSGTALSGGPAGTEERTDWTGGPVPEQETVNSRIPGER